MLFYAHIAIGDSLPDTFTSALKAHGIPASAVSVDIRELNSGNSILSLNSAVPRNPASVIKILTTLSALEMLGPSYQWETHYFADGTIKNGVLDGNLVMKGNGDPFLTVDRFWHQITTLRQLGIKKITGRLIFDNSAFSLPAHDRGAFDDRPTRLYNVGPDALMVNFSATRFVIRPFGGEVIVYADPPLAGLQIDNRIKASAGKCNSKNAGWKYGLEQNGQNLVARFSGTYKTRCGQHSIARALISNHEYAWRLFTYLWMETGGEFSGGYSTGNVSDDDIALTVHPSVPLADIVTSINKFSNNVMSRQLMLSLDAQVENHSATLEGARSRITAWSKVNGISLPGLHIDNGSGLSRKTRITSSGLADLLKHAWGSNYRAEFVSSLSLTALDGTMQKRLKDSPLRGRARIKTGLIKGVRSMAGYVNSRSGKQYSVVLMIESGSVTFSNGNAVQDALLEWLYFR